MRVTTEEMEIRGKETKTSKTGNEYILVRAEDDTGKLYELCDRNTARLPEYTKGRTCRFVLDIEIGRYTNISIVDIKDE